MEQKETIIDKIRKRRLTWFGHVTTRMENGRLPMMALHSQVDGRRHRGRPTNTWMDNIMEDIEAQGMDIREATDKASGFNTDYGSSEPLKTLVMLWYDM